MDALAVVDLTDAIRELTDFEKVSAGALTVKLIGIVTFDGKDRAKLTVSGTLRGIKQDVRGLCALVDELNERLGITAQDLFERGGAEAAGARVAPRTPRTA